MNYKSTTLISDDNPNVKLRVVHLKKKGSTNEEIRNLFAEIVDAKNCDIPLGTVIKQDGQEYVCMKAKDGCEGCAFYFRQMKCPDVYCLGDERADGFDIYFKLKRK